MMKCIICDRCGAIVEKIDDVRFVTCHRHMKYSPKGGPHQLKDVLWSKDVCVRCANDIEGLIPLPTPEDDDQLTFEDITPEISD